MRKLPSQHLAPYFATSVNRAQGDTELHGGVDNCQSAIGSWLGQFGFGGWHVGTAMIAMMA
jgi:hypothetical protein